MCCIGIRKRPQARAVPAQVGRQGRNAGRQQTPVMLPRAPVPKAPMQIHITNNTAKKVRFIGVVPEIRITNMFYRN
eukprot:6990432-Pyramimonas_sp.AAC.1